MKRIASWTALTLFGSVSWSAAHAALVEGFGTVETNHPDLVSIDTEYEHPVFLNVSKIVDFNPSPNNSSNTKRMAYFGQAQFGRLGVKSFVGGQTPAAPIHAGASLGLGFQDEITPENLNPLTSNYLRLDVELSGSMTRQDLTFGNSTVATFVVQMQSLDDPEVFRNLATVQFAWFGDDFSITNESGTGDDSFLLGFVPYPGEEPGFIPNPFPTPANFIFGARGYVDIPLGVPNFPEWPFEFGAPILLDVGVLAHSGTSTDTGVADTDFGSTALIGNARFVDPNGNSIPGASFTSASGYDYITPPGPLIPEPETCAMLLVGLGLLGFVPRRQR